MVGEGWWCWVLSLHCLQSLHHSSTIQTCLTTQAYKILLNYLYYNIEILQQAGVARQCCS